MNNFDFRRFFVRRKLESAAILLVAAGAAGAVVSNGPMLDRSKPAPVVDLLTRPAAAAPTPVAAVEMAPVVEWDIPNLQHASVDAWVGRFTGNMKRSLAVYLSRMDRYDDMIAKKAEERGLPEDLVYLAMIESGGNPTAKSPVKAMGLWQFMAPTAKQYGLKIGGGRDERADPTRATDAALEYLGDLYDRFGSWYLAAAAYNTGQGRVSRVLREVLGKSKGTDADFYRIAHRLPKETRDYVPKMIAAARIAKEPARYGFTPEYLASVGTTEKKLTPKKAVAKKTVAKKSTKKAATKKVAARKPAAKKRAG